MYEVSLTRKSSVSDGPTIGRFLSTFIISITLFRILFFCNCSSKGVRDGS